MKVASFLSSRKLAFNFDVIDMCAVMVGVKLFHVGRFTNYGLRIKKQGNRWGPLGLVLEYRREKVNQMKLD